MTGRFLVGLIGSGISASRSPEIHEREGRGLGLQVFYHLMDLNAATNDLPALLNAAQTAGFAGVNITLAATIHGPRETAMHPMVLCSAFTEAFQGETREVQARGS